ncbi:C-C motif chemokine 20-like [Protopterus annectens]|uniref:C-C motif chemokine 20-like n=1 Tax=Protopterus annectens TaxID=7888 RepID=UPI001CFB04D0|nr:C-C motif chemokine 20-like [Protopterus annectens]
MYYSGLVIISLSWLFTYTVEGFAGELARNCCLNVVQKKIDVQNIESHSIQNQDGNCPIHAVIFVLCQSKQKRCASPKEKWVKKAIKTLSKRKKNYTCRRRNQKDQQKKKSKQRRKQTKNTYNKPHQSVTLLPVSNLATTLKL